MQRGDVWWANLPEPVGSAPGYRRPVLIVQSDAFTRSRINTVLAVVITSNTALVRAPGNFLLKTVVSGLERESVANVSQVITLDRTLLTEYIASLPPVIMSKVEAGLRLVLAL